MIAGYDLPNQKIDKNQMFTPPYNLGQLEEIIDKFDHLHLIDHGNGFDYAQGSKMWQTIQDIAEKKKKILNVHMGALPILLAWDPKSRHNPYPNLVYYDNTLAQLHKLVSPMIGGEYPAVDFKNFLVSFNGTSHVSRQLLVSALDKRGWFNPRYSTKNFVYSADQIDGHLCSYLGDQDQYYRKFFSFDDDFAKSTYSIQYQRFDHKNNLSVLQQRLTESFVHLVSETLGTSTIIIGEKVFYSIATRGLFVPYGACRTMKMYNDVLGFRNYNKLFDYKFDTISDPVLRLFEILEMLSKYSFLSPADWHDLYTMEQETLEYNHHHFFSESFVSSYVKTIEKYMEQGFDDSD